MRIILSIIFMVSCTFSNATETGWIKDWIHDRFDVPKQQASKYAAAIIAASEKYDIAPTRIVGLISTESSFNPNAKSNMGAKGLTQVMTRYHKEKIKGRNLYNPITSIDVGVQVLRECLDKFDGNYSKAYGCYSGHGTKSKNGKTYIKSNLKWYAEIKQHLKVASILDANYASGPMVLASR